MNEHGFLPCAKEVTMRSGIDFERELDNLAFALQRDLLLLRLARMRHEPEEEKQKRCLIQLDTLRALLTQIEVYVAKEAEGNKED